MRGVTTATGSCSGNQSVASRRGAPQRLMPPLLLGNLASTRNVPHVCNAEIVRRCAAIPIAAGAPSSASSGCRPVFRSRHRVANVDACRNAARFWINDHIAARHRIHSDDTRERVRSIDASYGKPAVSPDRGHSRRANDDGDLVRRRTRAAGISSADADVIGSTGRRGRQRCDCRSRSRRYRCVQERIRPRGRKLWAHQGKRCTRTSPLNH